MTLSFIVSRRRRGPSRNLVSKLRLLSQQFKAHAEENDVEMMQEVSQEAWNIIVTLFNPLRNEQDSGRLADSYMNADTSIIYEC
jgi:hypothetical protein